MPMNIIIREKRKELGLTQEQVADYLGVSVPAVSKWEKGITCPDIGLLSPLARLLKIDLNTLFCFHEDLTPQEIGNFCNEIAHTAQNDIVTAFELAKAKLHEFPHNEELLLNITILLDSMLLQSDMDENARNLLDEKVVSWYSRLAQSSDSKISNSANYMLVSRYIRQEKLELAQSVLDTIQDCNEVTNALPDKLMLQVSIHLKQNKTDLAALELEKALYFAANRVQLLLTKLVDAELLAGKKEIAETIANRSLNIVELLDMWKYTGYVAEYQIASNEKNAEKTLSLLDRMLEALTSTWDLKDSPLFHRMAPEIKKSDTHQILSTLLKGLETDPDCDYLRDNPSFVELLAKYKTT